MKWFVFVLVILLSCSAAPVSGQISIDWTEIPQAPGSEWWTNTTDSVTVSLGTAGGPQSWDFTTQPAGPDSAYYRVVLKSVTPFADSFPSSNLVYKSVEDSTEMYSYMELTSGWLAYFGYGSVTPDTALVLRFDTADTIPLPRDYGDSGHFRMGYSVDIDTDYVFSFEWYGFANIDAYGTVTIPYGNFDCLRRCSFDTIATTFFYMGTPIMGDTNTFISYEFLAENRPALVRVSSHPNETNPNFTDAESIVRVTDFLLGIEESRTDVARATPGELRAFPNPFSDCCRVSPIEGAEGIASELEIYDIAGRLVEKTGKTLIGEDLRSGVYFLRVKGFVPLKILKVE